MRITARRSTITDTRGKDPKTKNATKVVVVTGDVTIDWNLARTRSQDTGGSVWNADDCSHAYWQRGGAALLADLVEAVARRLHDSGQADHEVHQMGAPRDPVGPGDVRYHHSYANWSLFSDALRPPAVSKERVWRVEEYMGLDRCPLAAGEGSVEWKKVVNDMPEADLLVLDDADLGFRDDPALWPEALRAKRSSPWILVKMARPVASGKLWEHLHTNSAERLVVVMTVNDLRLTEVQISRELSWERTAQDLAWELVHNPRVNALARCAHVVVSFATAGAILLSRPRARAKAAGGHIPPRCFLFFDPKVIEGMWEKQYPGGMIGYTTCLVAGLARRLMLAPEQPDIAKGIQSGLLAMRVLHREGYGQRETPAPQAALAFPTERIADELAREDAPLAVAEVQDPVRFLTLPTKEIGSSREAGFWTILQDCYPRSLDQVARQIVLRGAEAALQGVPLGRFGDLLTVDRREIEGFRSIRALVSEYDRQHLQKPLSIAVFGAPGSGKSFAIVELAKSLLGDRVKKLEFNLSQFSGPPALLDAFHQVRDVGLSGLMPLVFWDEFDSSLETQRLGWLPHFLAPMQDGKFQQGQITHPIGSAIFVFAGGTCESIEKFGTVLKSEEFRAVKGPDFISRVKGYVNILGPDPTGGDTSADPYYIIRRALLLRSILQRTRPRLLARKDGADLLNIDSGVLRAFLHTRQYKHGVRSMESIVTMSLLTDRSSFERSSLPAEAQLNLHVDGREFLALVQQMDLEGELLEKLARKAHEIFGKGLREKGYRWGPQTDDKRKLHSSLVPYKDLPEDEKEQNRGNVRDIANKLARIGCIMTPARSNEPIFGFPGPNLDLLAEMEHERWMRSKIAGGWRYASKTNKAKKLHRDLIPWHKLSSKERALLYSPAELAAIGPTALSEKEKQKDRRLVRGIPRMLAEAGYTIEKILDERPKE